MASKNNNISEPLENIESSLTKAEQFIEKHQNTIFYTFIGILAFFLAIWAINKFYFKPLNEEAKDQMYLAQKYFEKDSFALALNGNAAVVGFLQIIEDYSITKAANLAKFYAGICYLNLKDFDNAKKYLKKFKTKDPILASQKYGLIGDICVEKQQYDEAIKWYKKATKFSNNLTTPIYLKKLGLVYEQINNKEKALEVFSKINKEYPFSEEAKTIEKYIERVK